MPETEKKKVDFKLDCWCGLPADCVHTHPGLIGYYGCGVCKCEDIKHYPTVLPSDNYYVPYRDSD